VFLANAGKQGKSLWCGYSWGNLR